MSYEVIVRHNFETAHRLWSQGPEGKCWNFHGHSWWTDIHVQADERDERGMVVEYGELKAVVRQWIDEHLDHGAMLNAGDPFLDALREQKCKVMAFDEDPTVEAVSKLIADVVAKELHNIAGGERCRVERVRVQETHVNGAEYKP